MYTVVSLCCDERLVQQVILYMLFDLVQLYEDLVLCEEKSQIEFGGEGRKPQHDHTV